MKESLKRLARVGLTALLALCLMLVSAGAIYAETEEAAEQTDKEQSNEAYLNMFVRNLTQQVVSFDDSQLEELKQSTDAFSAAAANAWASNKEELGAYKEKQPEDAVKVELSEDKKIYTVTQRTEFENYDADFIYTINAVDGTPDNLTINVDLPMSVNMQRAGLNTLMGLGTVFVMLVFLCFVISLFKLIPNGENKKKAAETAVPVRAPEPAAAEVYEEDETDDQELVAVIAAAIAAAEGTTPDGFVVRSIRRAGRSRR